jgi:hypothetical protein
MVFCSRHFGKPIVGRRFFPRKFMELLQIELFRSKSDMRLRYLILLSVCTSCGSQESKNLPREQKAHARVVDTVSYDQLKKGVRDKKKLFFRENSNLTDQKNLSAIQDYWINTLLNDFYLKWSNTPWDYNGTTEQPKTGTIACGYFVTTLLRDMDVKIQRVKLAVCPSSEMMKCIVPTQRIINLSSLSNLDFNKKITELGKGVYIIGLDFHTGFIINDGSENWFLHSNYIGRQGVVKETVLKSQALRSSRTRWMVSLTSDTDFLSRWVER